MKTWARHSLAFLDNEKSGGIIMTVCAVASLVLANSSVSETYLDFWHSPVFAKPIEFWVNDGLMAIFFLQVGLEIEREVCIGELKDVKASMLPVLAAIGGMLAPAAIHFALNRGMTSQNGYGIPMATDIAFSLGVLSLLGNRVPLSLKIFLTALAIIDDLGAILVIAFFYSSHISLTYLAFTAGVVLLLIVLNRLNVLSLWVYLILGCVIWFFMYRSGIHASISGVLLALTIPFRHGDEKSPSTILQHRLHKPVTFFVLPLFALANTAIQIHNPIVSGLTLNNTLGIILGLVIGKPLGIFLFSWLGLLAGWCVLPHHLKLKDVFAVGILAGIGFTMSIFIALLAFDDPILINSSKLAVLIGSLVSSVVGLMSLRFMVNKK